jgi:hypothetical protein
MTKQQTKPIFILIAGILIAFFAFSILYWVLNVPYDSCLLIASSFIAAALAEISVPWIIRKFKKR